MQHIVTTPAALAELVAELSAAQAVALDTEFMRERTYRAELCLVQTATATRADCIDPLALPGLEGLSAPLTAGPVKVMHASRQDIEVLLPVAGLIRPVFDTQIAAALAGMPAQIGYGELVKRALGTELAKSQTRADWSKRPLSAEQVDYALDDVRYLLPLKQTLEAQLEQLGRRSWLDEELAALGDAQSFSVDPEQAWLRIKGLRGLDPGREKLARELAGWRERRAIERNRPRGWILDDIALREIVIRVPRDAGALAEVPELPAGTIKHSGDEILSRIAEAGIPDPAPPLNLRARPDPAIQALVKKLATVNQAVAKELGLSPEILVTRRDLERLAEGRQDIAALRGWRRSTIGERLLAAL